MVGAHSASPRSHLPCHGINLAKDRLAVLTSLPDASEIVRSIPLSADNWNRFASAEWLVTNGLGGYASGTVAGPPTRRYHTLLVAALPAPLGRVAFVTSIDASVGSSPTQLTALNALGDARPRALAQFRLVAGLPVWRYELPELAIERRLFMPHEQNTVVLTYTVVRASSDRVHVRLRPRLQLRLHEAPVDTPLPPSPSCVVHPRHVEIVLDPAVGPVRLALSGRSTAFHDQAEETHDVHYALEEQRGYPSRGSAWSPGYYDVELRAGEHVTVLASTDPADAIHALAPDDAFKAELDRRSRLLVAAGCEHTDCLTGELVFAADQFIIQPAARTADEARLRAAGGHARSVIAGYHWFTDWGRDTMISLEGLTLSTGRFTEARGMLLTFAHHLRDGLLPNLFPEGSSEGLYHTADATQWFFHAIDRYVTITDDRDTLRVLLPRLDEVVQKHMAGTRFGIRMDDDSLLTQGDPGLPLTWMDAKVDGWVVTPRRGKPVEINALWYNALRLLASWHRQFDTDASELEQTAARVKDSFNRRFWIERDGYLFDIVDGEFGDDASCRPNQILAVALRYPVLEESHWASVVDVVTRRLLTPLGLRTLDPADPAFKPQYFGDLRARDAAYHQGTVWAWLIGPFFEAWLRVHPGRDREALTLLNGFADHLNEACIGSISEIFDGTAPFTPRGCVAQAWSVAEVLRCLKRLTPATPAPPSVAGLVAQ
jgi:predicted glycogen debranching enzyme